MLLVALTGGIATGKSVVGQVWKQLGCYLHDSDREAHTLMEPGSPAWKSIVSRFGSGILGSDSRTIDRALLAGRVFNSPEDLDFLNGLLHPLVLERKKTLIARVRDAGRHRIFVSEAALTIEAGAADLFHKVVVTVCAPELQLMRLMARDHMPREDALRRIRAQMPAEEKARHADYVIRTEGPLTSTLEQAERVYRYLVQDYRHLESDPS